MQQKKFINIILVIITIIMFFLGILVSPKYRIATTEINGLTLLNEREVFQQLGITDETHILSVSAKDLKSKLSNNFYVKDLTIKRTFPDILTINIKERELIGYVPYVQQFLYIDTEGIVVDSQSEYTNPLPLIEGLNFSNFTLGEQILVDNNNAFTVAMQITNIMYEKDILNNVVRFDISDINDIHLYIGEVDVIFGSPENITTKINTLEEIFKSLSLTEKGYLYIDDISKDPIFKYIT